MNQEQSNKRADELTRQTLRVAKVLYQHDDTPLHLREEEDFLAHWNACLQAGATIAAKVTIVD